MRNRFTGGPCYRCGKLVKKGEGHFEKIKPTIVNGWKKRGWRFQHATCAIIHRALK